MSDIEVLLDIVLNDAGRINKSFWKNVDWNALLKKASHNRVLYIFSKNLLKRKSLLTRKQKSDLARIVAVGDLKMEAFQETVKFLNKSLGSAKIPFLIVKTFKFFDYVTFDVDVLVRYEDFLKAQKSLRRNGCKILPHPRKQGLHQRNCQKTGLLNIDLHRQFYWQGLEHIDLDLVWAKTQKRRINGIGCPCPSLEADFLLHNKQLVYERYYITLLDFLAVRSAYRSGTLDMQVIENQVTKYSWLKTYKSLLSCLNEINQTFFQEPLFKDVNTLNSRQVDLPYLMPYHGVWKQIFEIVACHRKVPLFDLGYYHYAFGRYFLSGKSRIPYYDHWFDFDSL